MQSELKPEIEAQLRLTANFPTPVGVATHIIALARDPEIEMGKVAKALSMDSALASKVLRIANSPLYALRRKSENLRQALVVLGLNATLTLALSFSLVKSLRKGASNGLDYDFYWRRALLAATAARALADVMRHPMAEEIFLAALLQDVGMLALDKVVPDLYRGGNEVQRSHVQQSEHERQQLGVDHAYVGAWLMGSWNLPQRLCDAIADSHTLELTLADHGEQVFKRSVALSGQVADLFLLRPDERQFAEAALNAERSLGLDKLAFGQVLGTVGAMIPETDAIFEADVLGKQSPEAILEQAREILMLRNLQALREINTLRSAAVDMSVPVDETQERARRDELTGVYNRNYMEQYVAREFENATRHRWPLSVALLELDGHPADESILQAAARLLRSNTRESDFISRGTGAEFVVILPATDAHTARCVCERIVTAFRNAAHGAGTEHFHATVSVGCATHGSQTNFVSASSLVDASAQALHAALQTGRDRTVSFNAAH